MQQCWKEIPLHYPNVVLDSFVVMPDHIHGILGLRRVTSIDSKVAYLRPVGIEQKGGLAATTCGEETEARGICLKQKQCSGGATMRAQVCAHTVSMGESERVAVEKRLLLTPKSL